MPPPLSVVIPTWNGLDLLLRFFPSVAAEAERWSRTTGGEVEVVVSDDESSDGSAIWLHQHYPGVRVITSATNRGFAPAANAGCFAATHEIVVLLNNDLHLVPGAFDTLMDWFHDPELFGVTFQGLDLPDLVFGTGGKLGRFRRGYWNTWRNFESAEPGHPSFMLVGGFCAFRRSLFSALGGFDAGFAPYYWEDVDLSYRARKRGWRTVYDPRPLVHHAQSVTVKRHRPAFYRAAVVERNRFLFHWRNLDRPRLAAHLFWAHLMLLQMAVKGNFAFHSGYVQALARLPQVFAFRRREKLHWRLADPELTVAAPDAANSIPAVGVSQ